MPSQMGHFLRFYDVIFLCTVYFHRGEGGRGDPPPALPGLSLTMKRGRFHLKMRSYVVDFLQIWRNRPLFLLRSGNGQIFLANKINVGIITRE